MVDSSEQQAPRGSGQSESGTPPGVRGLDGRRRAAGRPARRHSLGAIAVALIPFAAMAFSVPLWDRIEPVVLGLPFNLFWLACWEGLSALCLWLAYRLELAREAKDGRSG